MTQAVVPDVRPGLLVALRAVIAGSSLGALTGAALALGDQATATDRELLPGIALTAGGVGAGLAVLSAAGWLLTVGRGPRWLAELVAGVLASLPFGALLWISRSWWAAVATLLVAVVAALVARWQGYERDRVRPASSRRAG